MTELGDEGDEEAEEGGYDDDDDDDDDDDEDEDEDDPEWERKLSSFGASTIQLVEPGCE